MNIQNAVNNREGLLCAKNQRSDTLNKSTYKKSVGHYKNFVVQKANNMGVQAIKEVRTKESIKNNKLIRFVQYKKQPNIARQSLCPLNALIYRDNYPFVQYAKQPDNRSLKYLSSPKLASAKNNHSSLRGTVSDSAKFFAHGHSEHQGNFSLMMRLPDNIRLVGLAQSEEYCSKRSQPFGVMPKIFSQIGRKRSPSFFPQGIIDGAHDLINNKTISTANIIKGILCIIYPLDSKLISRLSSSLRNKRLTHPDLFSSPSSFIAIVKRSYNSLFNRNCTTYRSFIFSVDIVNSIKLVYYLVDNVLHCLIVSKIMPHSDSTHIGHLTTNDRSCIEVAMYKYTFLIGKGKTRLSEINPLRLISVLAKSENEARFLAGNRHLVFVARQGVHHA